ncbi:metallophosphoesterase [Bacillus suaedaesalsae]|uniref:Metallophosphoesterase n=1 Tax=Bacillus suaedaesalsae TaxID=2810349 RepID=A0ABS2DN18_9BACI|nr:metallophosphoesterase [Bacillus suaedaesalsae]MBM6619896.1 metallophosphoesterase [Bacillus suaedaesalsae]
MTLFITIFIGACLSMLLLLYMYFEAHKNVIVSSELYFNDFPDSFGKIRIYFISDIHKRDISSSMLNSIVDNVDLVIIGGDLTEKNVPFTRVEENIKKLRALGPCYFVWGNNDYEVDYRKLDSILLSNGVKILDNTSVTFESSTGEKICLLGVDDIAKERDRLDLAILDSHDPSFKILVSHNPQIVNQLKLEYHIRLILSGHTHGGQIRIGKFGPYKRGGVFTYGHSKLLISNGYGTTAIPLRLGAPAETHLLTIAHKK